VGGIAARFTDEDRKRIASAVFEAESKTAAEIVPVVAAASGRYDRAEDVVGLIVGIGAMVAAWFLLVLPAARDPAAGGWDGSSGAAMIWVMAALVVAGFAAGAFLAARIPALRRPFVPAGQMIAEAGERAAQLYCDERVRHTEADTGVLVYLSLFERRAVILADDAAYEALGPEAIAEECSRLTADAARGDLTAALCAAIGRLGERLAAKLPRGAGDRNELADALVVVE
jgi:putative membrane protein